MTELFTKVLTWIKSNIIIAVLIALAVVILLFPKLLRGLFGAMRKRKKMSAATLKRLSYSRIKRGSTLKAPVLNRSGTKKKAWQIKGSEAARRHMAAIRKLR